MYYVLAMIIGERENALAQVYLSERITYARDKRHSCVRVWVFLKYCSRSDKVISANVQTVVANHLFELKVSRASIGRERFVVSEKAPVFRQTYAQPAPAGTRRTTPSAVLRYTHSVIDGSVDSVCPPAGDHLHPSKSPLIAAARFDCLFVFVCTHSATRRARHCGRYAPCTHCTQPAAIEHNAMIHTIIES